MTTKLVTNTVPASEALIHNTQPCFVSSLRFFLLLPLGQTKAEYWKMEAGHNELNAGCMYSNVPMKHEQMSGWHKQASQYFGVSFFLLSFLLIWENLCASKDMWQPLHTPPTFVFCNPSDYQSISVENGGGVGWGRCCRRQIFSRDSCPGNELS